MKNKTVDSLQRRKKSTPFLASESSKPGHAGIEDSQNFPKSLLGFYARFGVKPFVWILSAWALIYFVQQMLTRVVSPFYDKWFIGLFETSIPAGKTLVQFAVPTILLIAFLYTLEQLLVIWHDKLISKWRPKINQRLSEILFIYVNYQSYDFHTRNMAGKVISQIQRVSNGFSLWNNFMRISVNLIATILSMLLVINISNTIAIMLLVVFVLRFIYTMILIKPIKRASKIRAESGSELSGQITDSITNFTIVKLFSMLRSETKHIRKQRDKLIKNSIDSSYWMRWSWAVPNTLWAILWVATLFICVVQYQQGTITVAEIVFISASFNWIMANISNIVNVIPEMFDTFGDSSQAYKELVRPIDIMDVPNAPDLRVPKGAIEIKNVSFYYENAAKDSDAKDEKPKSKKGAKDSPADKKARVKKRKVLENFSLSIRPGEKVGLVGSSGAGKTTLVNLLMRFYDPASGGIYIDGQDIREVKQDSLRENIAFIPQEPTMFNRSLRENIGYGKSDATDAQIRRAAKNAAADKFIMESPKKYDSMVGDRGIKLSGGQRQRIAIARAFLKDAPILILDEATSALDSETEAAIQTAFEKLSAGRTTIVIAHRLSTLRNMDRIIVIDHGKVIEQGSHNQLLRKRGGTYARLWKMQSGGFLKE